MFGDPTPDLMFDVIGPPSTQGSKRHVGKGVMIESNKQLKPWRDSVISAARTQIEDDYGSIKEWTPIDGPVILLAVFSLPRPASAPKKVTRPFRTPDLDKLLRALLDSLTMSGVVVDDARVVSIISHKVFAGSDSPHALDVPGVHVEVYSS